MRSHHRVCYIPARPDHKHNVGPDWLEPCTCTVVLLSLHSFPLTVQVQRSMHCLLKPWAVRRRGIPALPAWTWNLYCGRLSHHHATSLVVHPACLSCSWRPQSNPHLCLGLGWHLDVQTEHRRGPGFTFSEAEAKGGLKRFSISFVFFFLTLCSCVYVCAGFKGHNKSLFCLRYVADFHLFSDTGKMVDVQHCCGKGSQRRTHFKPFVMWERFQIYD